MQRVPADYDPSREPVCSGYSVPSIEAIIAVGGTVLAIGMAQGWLGGGGGKALGGINVVVGGVMGLVFGLIPACSSITGFVWANTCQDAHDRHDEWLSSLPKEELLAWESAKYKKDCTKLKEKYEKLPTSEKLKRYYGKCREFIKKDLNTPDNLGLYQLHYAVKEDSKKKTKRLLGLGADPNVKDKHGWTPLHYAASIGSEGVVELLLNKGADQTNKDNQGKAALDIATEKGHEDVVQILRRTSKGRK
jgi:hypothetical protein